MDRHGGWGKKGSFHVFRINIWTLGWGGAYSNREAWNPNGSKNKVIYSGLTGSLVSGASTIGTEISAVFRALHISRALLFHLPDHTEEPLPFQGCTLTSHTQGRRGNGWPHHQNLKLIRALTADFSDCRMLGQDWVPFPCTGTKESFSIQTEVMSIVKLAPPPQAKRWNLHPFLGRPQ